MKAIIALLFFTINISGVAIAQTRGNSYTDVTFGAGRYRGSLSLAYWRHWQLGQKQKLAIGVGVRFSSVLGANLYYSTAPSRLTSESTSPLILFKDNIGKNIDSLLVKSPQMNMVNVMMVIEYKVTDKFTMGFNIDAVGFSFGGSQKGNYMNGASGKITMAKPTPFNVLLISDNDRGSLNSEFYLRYRIDARWSLKAGAQFLFTEYTTATAVQQLPEANDRFRNKSLLFSIGFTHKLIAK